MSISDPQGYKLCPSCGASSPLDAQTCLRCGHIFRTHFPQAPPNQTQAFFGQQAPPQYPQHGYHSQPAPYYRPHQPQSAGLTTADGLAIASLVMGIGSMILFCAWFLAIPCAILGFLFALFGWSSQYKGLAVAGLACSSVGLLGALAILVLISL